MPPVRSISSSLGALEAWRTMASPRRDGSRLLFRLFLVSSSWWWGDDYILESEWGSLHTILVSVMHLALAEGAWSCASRRSCRIQSVFVFIGVVSYLSLLIDWSHLWQWLLLWCAGSFGVLARQLFVLLLQQALRRQALFCSGVLLEERGRWRAFGCSHR
jgi:hypothetical protein